MRLASVVLVPLLLLSCKLDVFDELEASAPIVSLAPPGDYPRGTLGRVMDAYVGENAFGEPIARVVAAGGPGTPLVVFDVWEHDRLGELHALDTRCNDPGAPDSCEAGIGGDVVGLASWMGMKDCLLTSAVPLPGGVPSTGEGTVRVVCERSPTSIARMAVPAVQLGRSLAALPEGHPAGVALIGAPGADGGRGTLYRLEDGGLEPVPLPMPTDLTLAADASLGDALATMGVGTSVTGLDEPVLVAVGATGMRRVFVFEVGSAGGALESRTVGCIDEVQPRRPADEAGGGLTVGDIGQGPTVFVGLSDDLSGEPLAGSVRAVRVADLVATPGCVDPSSTDDASFETIDCAGVPDLECKAFGRGVAVGDVNGDGFGDLVVGAPLSLSPNEATGAVVVFPGSATGLGSGRAIVPTSVGDGARFGQRVTMARTALGTAQERAEPVVAAPAETRLYILFCTGLDGDRADALGDLGDRCLPQQP